MLANDWGITLYFTVLAAITGAAGGSFVNCLAWRLVRGRQVTRGRSCCPSCGHVLGAPDLVPVVSWFALKGRCRYCGERIPFRYAAVELLAGAGAVCILFRYGLTLKTPFYLVFSLILLGVALTDLESYEIPDRFHVSAILWWCAGALISEKSLAAYFGSGLLGGGAIAGGMLAVSLIFDRLLGRESLGGGDVKLFFVTGLYLGLAVNLLNLIVSCILALGLAFVLADSRKKRDDPAAIPFGPAIAAGTWLCLLAGDAVIKWYLGLFGLL